MSRLVFIDPKLVQLSEVSKQQVAEICERIGRFKSKDGRGVRHDEPIWTEGQPNYCTITLWGDGLDVEQIKKLIKFVLGKELTAGEDILVQYPLSVESEKIVKRVTFADDTHYHTPVTNNEEAPDAPKKNRRSPSPPP